MGASAFCVANLCRKPDIVMAVFYDHIHSPKISTSVYALAKDYPKGAWVKPHRHNCAQLIYAVQGVMRVTTPRGSWIVPPLRAVWVPAEIEHEIHMANHVAMRTLYVLQSAVASLPSDCVVVKVSELLRALIIRGVKEPEIFDENDIADKILALIAYELRCVPATPLHIPLPQDQRLSDLCQEVLRQPHAQTTLENLAQRLHVSERTFTRLFRQQIGMSFTAWRQQVRLAEALTQLAEGQPIARVAWNMGYHSASAFTTMFRRLLGTTPGRYFEGATPDEESKVK